MRGVAAVEVGGSGWLHLNAAGVANHNHPEMRRYFGKEDLEDQSSDKITISQDNPYTPICVAGRAGRPKRAEEWVTRSRGRRVRGELEQSLPVASPTERIKLA